MQNDALVFNLFSFDIYGCAYQQVQRWIVSIYNIWLNYSRARIQTVEVTKNSTNLTFKNSLEACLFGSPVSTLNYDVETCISLYIYSSWIFFFSKFCYELVTITSQFHISLSDSLFFNKEKRKETSLTCTLSCSQLHVLGEKIPSATESHAASGPNQKRMSTCRNLWYILWYRRLHRDCESIYANWFSVFSVVPFLFG